MPIFPGSFGGAGAPNALRAPSVLSLKYLPLGSDLIADGANIVDEPFVVEDPDNPGTFLCFYFIDGGSLVCAVATASVVDGTWTPASTFLNGYHKLALLLDPYGVPAKVNGKYYAYVVSFPTKEIYVATASTLQGTWTLGAKMLALGTSGFDEAACDCPHARLIGGVVYLFYSGSPSASDETYGYAWRIGYATAASPAGPFTKQGVVLNPSTNNGDFDYGYVIGAHLTLDFSGLWVMNYAGNPTRPDSSATETDACQQGFATASTLAGPWTKAVKNPYISKGSYNGIWRAFLFFNRQIQKWVAFFGHTLGGGGEGISLCNTTDMFASTGGGGGGALSLLDTSGNGNNLTNNGVTVGSQGAYFDGSAGYLSASDEALPSGNSARTITLDIYPTLLQPNPPGTANGNAFTYGTFTDEEFQAISCDNAYLNYAGYADDLQYATPPPLNTWTSIAATYDGATATLYVNGTSVATLSTSSWDTVLAGTAYIGCIFGGTSEDFFEGYIRKVRVFSRVLSGTEITNLANGASAPSNCVAEWLLGTS